MLLYKKKKRRVSVLSKRPNYFTTKAVLLCFNEQSESLLLQVKKKLEQRIAVTHLKFRASFPTSICIEVINYSSSKYYSTKPTFSVTQQTRQLCGRFRCPLIQHWPFNFDVFCLWFVIGVVVTLNWQLNERPKCYEKSSQKSLEFWFLTEHLIKLHAQQ